MDKYYSHCIFIALLSLASASWAKPTELPYFSATYDASIHGLAVQATREFKAVNNEISELRFSATSFLASLTESAQFSWDKHHIRPIEFKHTRNILGSERNKELNFNWANNTILSTDKEKTYTIPNPEQALDRLSFQLQLQYDLLVARQGLTYRIADKNRIKEYRFEIIGEEKLSTDLGTFQTIKVKVIRGNKKRKTFLWLAKDWHHLLTKLEQYKNDKKEFELQLTSAIVDGKKVLGL